MSKLIAVQYDVEATVKFKDVTWILPEDKNDNLDLYDELAGLAVVAATQQMLAEELAFLNKPESFGGFTLDVAVSNPVDVTEVLEAEITAED
jgi:hypothetical protein